MINFSSHLLSGSEEHSGGSKGKGHDKVGKSENPGEGNPLDSPPGIPAQIHQIIQGSRRTLATLIIQVKVKGILLILAKVEAMITGVEMEEMKRVGVKGKGKDRDINPKIDFNYLLT